MGGLEGEVKNQSIKTDITGNVFVTGIFTGTIDVDPSDETYNLIATSAVHYDIFICKLDADGNFVWAKQFSGDNKKSVFDLAIDANSNVYVTGDFYKTVDFDPSTDIYNLSSDNFTSIFICKLDNEGNFGWVKQIITSVNDGVALLTTVASGDVYITSNFLSSFYFEPGRDEHIANGGVNDILICKLNSNGDFGWAKTFGGSGGGESTSIISDSQSNIYITGTFYGTMSFDPDDAVNNLITADGSYTDIFISKYNSNGEFIWVKQLKGSSNDNKSVAIEVDSEENVYTSGYFSQEVDFNTEEGTFNLASSGNADIFIHKLNSDATFVIENNSQAFKAYPNPTMGKFDISFNKLMKDLRIEIRDITGRLISTQSFNSTNKISVEVPGESGLYFIKLSEQNKRPVVIKVIKE